MHAEPENSGPALSPFRGADPSIFTSRIPLFHAAWLFACGIALANAAWLRPGFVLLALAFIAVLCCIAALRAQRVVPIALAALWCLLGAWCAEMEPQPAPAPIVANLSDGLLRTVEGTLISTGSVQNEAPDSDDTDTAEGLVQRVDLRVSSIEFVDDNADRQMPVADGAVRITVRWPAGTTDASPFRCGERVRALVRMLPPEVYHTPGAWSRAAYLLDQGITSTGSVDLAHIDRIGSEPHRSLACLFSEWQHTASARL
ncbi:MAG: ComEC/Rec2 family competence protein, partial [Terracidiphilus sp.]